MSAIPAPNIAQNSLEQEQVNNNTLAEYTRAAQERAQTAQIQQQTQQKAALAPGELQQQQQVTQAQQRLLADQDALTKTITQYDPSKNSLADIPHMVTANGGSGAAALQAQQGLITQKQSYLKMTDEQFAQQQKQADLTQGVHDAVTTAKPEDKQNVYSQGLQRLAAAGVDVSKEPPQYPGDDAFAQHLAPIQIHSAIVDDAAKERQAQEEAAKARSENATAAHQEFVNNLTKNSKPGDFDTQVDAILPPTGATAGQNHYTKTMVDGALSRGDLPTAQKIMDEAFQNVNGTQKEIAVATNPQIQAGKVEVAKNTAVARQQAQAGGFGAPGDPMVDMVGQNRVDLATALQRVPPAQKDAFLTQLSQKYPDYNQGTFGVAKKEQTAYTSGTQGQQLTAIDTARQHMQTFKQTADALDNGDFLLANKVGNTVGMQFGSDKATNFNIAKSAFAGEVGKAFAGANVGVSDRQELMDKINAASSPAQLKGYADTADKLLEGKQVALKRSYDQGVQGKANFGGAAGGSQHLAGGAAQGLKEGATGTGSDGKKYVVKNGVWVAQ